MKNKQEKKKKKWTTMGAWVKLILGKTILPLLLYLSKNLAVLVQICNKVLLYLCKIICIKVLARRGTEPSAIKF